MRRTQKKTVLFDLDGTLVDPAQGVVAAYQTVLKDLNLSVPEHDDLTWIIGPPLRRSFETFLRDPDVVERAVVAYRAAYGAQGLFDATPYEGIKPVLQALVDEGYQLFVCTAKAVGFAHQVIEHFGFALFFDGIYGAEIDGRFDDKGDLIAHIMTTESLVAGATLMIGDRANDTQAATRNGLNSIGVLWGFGDESELRASGATTLCKTPVDIFKTVVGLLGPGV